MSVKLVLTPNLGAVQGAGRLFLWEAAESCYHPIKGEALAASLGLEKCKFFVLGLSNLVLCFDHAPLLATFGSQDIEKIHNPRLINFKIKYLAFRCRVCQISGKEQVTADAPRYADTFG